MTQILVGLAIGLSLMYVIDRFEDWWLRNRPAQTDGVAPISEGNDG